MTVFQDQPNPSAVLLRAGELVVQNLPVPELGPTDVLVNIKATGICGSDIHYFAHGRNGNIVVKEPLVMGHESSGEIVAIGSAVQSLKPGDRVAVEPGVTCRTCNMCKSGLYNLCPDVAFAATPPVHGTLCRYYKHPEDLCFKLPDNVSYEEGALVEPLSVGLYSIERGNVKVGDRVIIFGAGPVGLLCAAAAKAAGAACVMIADIAPSRLKFAASYYTDVQILLDKPSPNEPNIEYARRTATRILEDYGGYADCVLDCTGVETCVQLAVLLTKNGGAAVLVGLGASIQALPVDEIANRQVDIRGIRRYCNVSTRYSIAEPRSDQCQAAHYTHLYNESSQGSISALQGSKGWCHQDTN
ncbi:hypothetical protein LRAMOSA02448 [Lichtheimia ramosa]|uniref:Enoyl reductase (ER) domain-containing protein n=1 Tax=Lichtheimia ramosa TaxID=688394 RepID=A0A077WQB2_9FUNG|nr:hypothetical protein LRAMOSA02448 [Lichtheimia ramosa]